MAKTGPTVDAHWELVTRVADSSLFQRSGRLRELLLYVCQRSMQGRFDELRELRIGIDVFARGPDFRPSEDNIVRVEARQLRKRLEDYFATEGKAEPIVITIPKGAYVASFEQRAVAPEPVETPIPAPPAEIEPPVPQQPLRPSFPWAVLFGTTTVLLLVLTSWLYFRNRESLPRPSGPRVVIKTPVWSEMFDKDHQTYIVCSDSALVLLQELIGRPVTLAEYVRHSYITGPTKSPSQIDTLLRLLPQRQYTNMSDVRLVKDILQLNDEYRERSVVRSARNMQLMDFKNGNFILLGSKRSTPWDELFEPSMNFHFAYDAKLKLTGFSNLHPRPGEKSVYWSEGSPTEIDATYGLIAFLPNLGHNGNVLIIQGATGEGTEAAGEYVTHAELLHNLLKTIRADEDGRLHYFEVLLKSRTIAGTPRDAAIISYRLIPDAK